MNVSNSITPLKARDLQTTNQSSNGLISIGKWLKNMLTGCKPELQKQLSKENGIWSKDIDQAILTYETAARY